MEQIQRLTRKSKENDTRILKTPTNGKEEIVVVVVTVYCCGSKQLRLIQGLNV